MARVRRRMPLLVRFGACYTSRERLFAGFTGAGAMGMAQCAMRLATLRRTVAPGCIRRCRSQPDVIGLPTFAVSLWH